MKVIKYFEPRKDRIGVHYNKFKEEYHHVKCVSFNDKQPMYKKLLKKDNTLVLSDETYAFSYTSVYDENQTCVVCRKKGLLGGDIFLTFGKKASYGWMVMCEDCKSTGEMFVDMSEMIWSDFDQDGEHYLLFKGVFDPEVDYDFEREDEITISMRPDLNRLLSGYLMLLKSVIDRYYDPEY